MFSLPAKRKRVYSIWRLQYKKFLLFTAGAHGALQMNVLHKFPFKPKQSFTHSLFNRFAPCKKLRMLFFFLCFLKYSSGNTSAARASWFSWKHKAWCTCFSHCCHQAAWRARTHHFLSVWPSLYLNILESSRSCKIKHYKNPDNLSAVVVVKVSSVISILETGGYSAVQCLWTEKLEKGRVVYDK